MNYRVLCMIFLFALVGCNDDEVAVDDLEGQFELVWGDFDRTYSYFEVKKIDWDSVYLANRSKIINGQTTSSELAVILSEMILALKDLHVRFVVGNTTYRFQNGDQFESNSPSNSHLYLSSITFDTNTLLIGNIENMDVSYVRIKNLSGSGDFQPLESVHFGLPDKEGLIIDLRDNGGGDDAIARSFVNRLTQQEITYELVRYRNGPGRDDFGDWIGAKVSPVDPISFEKPIMVLTNRGVASSAESFVNMLKTLPNTTFLGDTTRGSTGNPKEFLLPIGWKYSISTWQVATPEFKFIEDQGIAPDIIVYNSDDSMNEGRDLILEKAIELLE